MTLRGQVAGWQVAGWQVAGWQVAGWQLWLDWQVNGCLADGLDSPLALMNDGGFGAGS